MTASDDTPAGPRVAFATWAGFLAMCLGMFMAILDIQIVVTSLPEIRKALDIAPDDMSWVQTAYLIAEVIAIPLTGLLTRIFSLRWLFVTALAIFTFASIGCATSSGLGELVAWRLVQGFAGGAVIPLVFSAVFLLFPFRAQGVATTIAGVLAVLAPTCGPLAGGWITQSFSWRWLFLVNVAPGVVSILFATLFLRREAPDWRAVRHVDAGALALLCACLASLEIALKEAPARGWSSVLPVTLLGVALVAGVAFVARSLTRAPPVVDLRALQDRNFAVGCALSFALGMALYGSVYLMPVFLAFVRERGPLAIGWIMLATGAAQLAAAPFAVALERRFDARILTCFGFALFALGLFLSGSATQSTDAGEMFWPQALRGAACMFCLLPPTRLALGHFEQARVGDASGLFNLMRNLGGAIGIALIDTIIYGRGPGIAERLSNGLASGDAAAIAEIGATPDLMARAFSSGEAQSTLQQLVARQTLVQTTNEAWLMLAIVMAFAVLLAPFARDYPKSAAGSVH